MRTKRLSEFNFSLTDLRASRLQRRTVGWEGSQLFKDRTYWLAGKKQMFVIRHRGGLLSKRNAVRQFFDEQFLEPFRCDISDLMCITHPGKGCHLAHGRLLQLPFWATVRNRVDICQHQVADQVAAACDRRCAVGG